MLTDPTPFLWHWTALTAAIWLASQFFKGLRFDGLGAVIASAFLLGLANLLVRPILIVLTFPLTILTLGLFLLVINGFMLLLVARFVKGFHCDGFGTAFWASMVIALLTILLEFLFGSHGGATLDAIPNRGMWL